jgi:cytochrome b
MSKRSQDAPARIKWGPEELAVRWGIPISRVLHWIVTGQLRAVDASDRLGGDPDYRVDIVDLAMFVRRQLLLLFSDN